MYKPSGIIQITGEHDSGKTRAALGLVHPKKIAFFHDDIKVPPISREEFGHYTDMVADCEGKTLLQVKDYILSIVSKFKPNQYDVIVFDTWSRFGLALRSWGKNNALKFREDSTMAKGQVYRWGQEWGEGHLYEGSVISKLATLTTTLVIITHLKDHYAGNAATGKQIPDSGKILEKACNLRLWLRHNSNSGVPIALVLKRLAKDTITDNGLESINILPRKITPLETETSIWDMINRYHESPIGNRKPLLEETPTDYESSVLDGVLTEDQKQIWQANLIAKKQEEQDTLQEVVKQDQAIKELVKEEFVSNPDFAGIQKMIKEKFNRDLNFSEITEMIR